MNSLRSSFATFAPPCASRRGCGAFNRALWCLSFVSGISLSADLSVLGFAGGLGLVLSLSRSPRLRPSGLSDCRRGDGHSSQSASELRPYVFVPLLSGGPGPSPWPSPVKRERGREVPYVWGAPSIFGRHTSQFRSRASGPSHVPAPA